MSDAQLEFIDQLIEAKEVEKNSLETQLLLCGEELSELSDVRRRLTGLTQGPTRLEKEATDIRIAELERENERLRGIIAAKEQERESLFPFDS